jgi:hypothetical protein
VSEKEAIRNLMETMRNLGAIQKIIESLQSQNAELKEEVKRLKEGIEGLGVAYWKIIKISDNEHQAVIKNGDDYCKDIEELNAKITALLEGKK